MVRGIIIPASDSQEIVLQEFVELEDYQRTVGGWIEAVDIPDFGVTLYVNEEGLLRGLPFNRRATFLWWFHAHVARGKARLVGDAVVVGLPDQDGNTTNVPDEVRACLLSPTQYNVAWRELDDTRWRPSPEDHDDYLEAIIWATLLMEYAAQLQVNVVPVDRTRNNDETHP